MSNTGNNGNNNPRGLIRRNSFSNLSQVRNSNRRPPNAPFPVNRRPISDIVREVVQKEITKGLAARPQESYTNRFDDIDSRFENLSNLSAERAMQNRSQIADMFELIDNNNLFNKRLKNTRLYQKRLAQGKDFDPIIDGARAFCETIFTDLLNPYVLLTTIGLIIVHLTHIDDLGSGVLVDALKKFDNPVVKYIGENFKQICGHTIMLIPLALHVYFVNKGTRFAQKPWPAVLIGLLHLALAIILPLSLKEKTTTFVTYGLWAGILHYVSSLRNRWMIMCIIGVALSLYYMKLLGEFKIPDKTIQKSMPAPAPPSSPKSG